MELDIHAVHCRANQRSSASMMGCELAQFRAYRFEHKRHRDRLFVRARGQEGRIHCDTMDITLLM
jgi:hypothetical protein